MNPYEQFSSKNCQIYENLENNYYNSNDIQYQNIYNYQEFEGFNRNRNRNISMNMNTNYNYQSQNENFTQRFSKPKAFSSKVIPQINWVQSNLNRIENMDINPIKKNSSAAFYSKPISVQRRENSGKKLNAIFPTQHDSFNSTTNYTDYDQSRKGSYQFNMNSSSKALSTGSRQSVQDLRSLIRLANIEQEEEDQEYYFLRDQSTNQINWSSKKEV